VREHDVIINLAGAFVFSRWTSEQEQILLSRRIETTRNQVESILDSAKHNTFFSTSAMSSYGFLEDLAQSSST
jgi:NAD dependent epimerase/dehydratase family enzyme